jgi:general secretion pathway protein G
METAMTHATTHVTPRIQPNQKTRAARRRKLRAQQGMTLIEIMIVMVIMALVAGGAAFAILPRLKEAKIKQTQQDAKKVASAAEMYLSEHDDCPSVDKLLEMKILSKKSHTADAWDNAFAIECDDDGATVKSAGPDKQMGTEDDIE